MSNTITLFATLTNPTLPELDADLTIVSNQAHVPCTVSGSDALTFTQIPNLAYTVAAYQQNLQLAAVASSTNGGATTGQLGALAILPIYKDGSAGPVPLTGGEIVSGNAFTLVYDVNLNSGTGGWHLYSSTADKGLPINPGTLQLGSGSVMDHYFTTLASVTIPVVAGNSAQGVTILLGGAVPGDAVLIGPPTVHPTSLDLMALVSASGSIVLVALNPTAASQASIAAAYRVSVLK
jgi:hypothetical protein